jgi:hypothetical protein
MHEAAWRYFRLRRRQIEFLHWSFTEAEEIVTKLFCGDSGHQYEGEVCLYSQLIKTWLHVICKLVRFLKADPCLNAGYLATSS